MSPIHVSNHSLSVEEEAGPIYFDVVRRSGDLGRVSVDLVTRSQSASSIQGQQFHLGLIQQVVFAGFNILLKS